MSLILAAAILTACAPAPPPIERPRRDPTVEAWYGETIGQLAAMNREAERLLQSGESDAAAAIVTKGQALQSRLLSVPQPTLAAMQAASDLDRLYGRMLLANRRYGWARLVFQKDLTRWKHWKPETADTARRLKLAESAIGECDRGLR